MVPSYAAPVAPISSATAGLRVSIAKHGDRFVIPLVVATGAPPRLAAFASWWIHADPRELRERSVTDLDLRGGTALYLTHHRFGDRRERGRALIALKRLYRDAGRELDHWELPDYLPIVLELAAVGMALLTDCRVELQAIRRNLERAESPWAGLGETIGFALWPFSRLVRVWTVPVQYVVRHAHILYRGSPAPSPS